MIGGNSEKVAVLGNVLVEAGINTGKKCVIPVASIGKYLDRLRRDSSDACYPSVMVG